MQFRPTPCENILFRLIALVVGGMCACCSTILYLTAVLPTAGRARPPARWSVSCECLPGLIGIVCILASQKEKRINRFETLLPLFVLLCVTLYLPIGFFPRSFPWLGHWLQFIPGVWFFSDRERWVTGNVPVNTRGVYLALVLLNCC